MTVARPRPSATVCLLHDRQGRVEVLMVRRGRGARFMGGAWVFPGGAVDASDRGEQAARVFASVPATERPWVAAATRELVEEAGVWLARQPLVLSVADRPRGGEVFARALTASAPLDGTGLALFANWLTPTAVPVRFDARFYVTATDVPVAAEPDGEEVDAAEWIAPVTALDRAATGDFSLPLPTRRILASFAELGSAGAIVEHARSLATVEPVMPRLRRGGGGVEAVLPGEPGYDDLADESPRPEMLAGASDVRSAADDVPDPPVSGGRESPRNGAGA